MANDLTIVKDNWLVVADKIKDAPVPFQHEIFLLECHVAGTTYVGDIEAKTENLAEGDMLTLQRDPENKYDSFAIAVYTAKKDRIGWVSRYRNTVLARLMDAGKLLYARVASKELVEENTRVDMRMKIFMRDV